MKKVLLLFSNINFANLLRAELIQKEIDVEIIYNIENFNPTDDSEILIDAHFGNTMSEFDGLVLFSTLRKKGIKSKIIIFSWYSFDQLVLSDKYYIGDFTYLLFNEEDSNSYYIQLPVHTNKISKLLN